MSLDYFRKLFDVVYSSDAARREQEQAAYRDFMHYIEDCKGG